VNCWAWTYDFHPVRALTGRELDAMQDASACIANTCPGPIGRSPNKDNDYLMDRAAQKAGPDLIAGSPASPARTPRCRRALGPICDRTKENLVSTDNGIIMARHRLMRAAKAADGKRRHSARCRSRAPQGALGLGGACPPDQAFQGRPPRKP